MDIMGTMGIMGTMDIMGTMGIMGIINIMGMVILYKNITYRQYNMNPPIAVVIVFVTIASVTLCFCLGYCIARRYNVQKIDINKWLHNK